MTLPALITKYKKQQTVTHLKKVYTSLNQAMRLSEAEYGPYENWDIGYGKKVYEYYEKYWYPHFKIIKNCDSPEVCGYKSYYPWDLISGNPSGFLFTNDAYRVPFILSDGTLISISVAGGDYVRDNNIYVDLNGSKAPNKYGIDAFLFTRIEGKGVLPYHYYKNNEEIDDSCQTCGFGCAAKIMKDGWEIKDDYPWK